MCKPKKHYVCHLHVGVQKPEESVGSPGAEVTQHGCRNHTWVLLQGQQGLLNDCLSSPYLDVFVFMLLKLNSNSVFK